MKKTFGVEIEFVTRPGRAGTYPQIAYELQQLTGEPVTYVGYSHEHVPFWKLVTDSSCELEIVSPILSGPKDMQRLKKMCEALGELERREWITINTRCGLHVHHGVKNRFTLEWAENLMKCMTYCEDVIDQIMPDSRQDNRWCRRLSSSWNVRYPYRDQYSQISSLAYRTDRYTKVNLHAYIQHGTVEFRQHSGTFNFEKISNWIKITQAMLYGSREISCPTTPEAQGVLNPTSLLIELLKSEYPDLNNTNGVLHRLVDSNPKQNGAAPAVRFDGYKDARTVCEFFERGGTKADLRWDVSHGFFRLSTTTPSKSVKRLLMYMAKRGEEFNHIAFATEMRRAAAQ